MSELRGLSAKEFRAQIGADKPELVVRELRNSKNVMSMGKKAREKVSNLKGEQSLSTASFLKNAAEFSEDEIEEVKPEGYTSKKPSDLKKTDKKVSEQDLNNEVETDKYEPPREFTPIIDKYVKPPEPIGTAQIDTEYFSLEFDVFSSHTNDIGFFFVVRPEDFKIHLSRIDLPLRLTYEPDNVIDQPVIYTGEPFNLPLYPGKDTYLFVLIRDFGAENNID